MRTNFSSPFICSALEFKLLIWPRGGGGNYCTHWSGWTKLSCAGLEHLGVESMLCCLTKTFSGKKGISRVYSISLNAQNWYHSSTIGSIGSYGSGLPPGTVQMVSSVPMLWKFRQWTYLSDGLDRCTVLQQKFNDLDSVLLASDMQGSESIL